MDRTVRSKRIRKK